jgi:hypothetical protein
VSPTHKGITKQADANGAGFVLLNACKPFQMIHGNLFVVDPVWRVSLLAPG